MPINYVMLAVMTGIIGLVVGGFTCWHILLAARGQTTIECLEKTRYLSPIRNAMQHQHMSSGQDDDSSNGEQFTGMTTPPAPGSTMPGDGEVSNGETRYQSYDAMARFRARERYDQYLDEQDSEKLPSAFDLGWKRNLQHLFGPYRTLWIFPINNTTGDGWKWEPSPKWLRAREDITREREAQRSLEAAAGWGAEPTPPTVPVRDGAGAGRHYVRSYPSRPTTKADKVLGRPTSKADRILGRNPDQYIDEENGHSSHAVSMQTFSQSRESGEYTDDYLDSDDDVSRPAMGRKTTPDWSRNVQKFGIMANTVLGGLGNTMAGKKDDPRDWDSQDDGVD